MLINMGNKIGVLSDIHANRFALEAVFEDIEKNDIDLILNLGDTLYGPLDPIGTYNLISSKRVVSISGNQDRFIIENEDEIEVTNTTLAFVLKSLPQEAFAWLKTLKKEETKGDIYMCHGKFQQDDIPLVEKICDGSIQLKTQEELEVELACLTESLILCGHTHVPRITKTFSSAKYIINPGSVGLPAYDDDSPYYHKMESGSPMAKYAIIEFEEEKIVAITQRSVNYDFVHAAKEAAKNGRPDWAYWILNGKAK